MVMDEPGGRAGDEPGGTWTPGIYPGLSRAEYDAIPGVNQSLLKQFRRSPAHAKQYLDDPSPATPSQALGTAIHTAVLDLDGFHRDYVVPPKCDRRTTLGKATWERFTKDYPKATLISADDFAIVQGICSALRHYPPADEILRSPGPNEVGIVWTDAETGLLCKALLDGFRPLLTPSIVFDLKSTEDASPSVLRWEVIKYAYDVQAAWYLSGLEALAPAPRRFIFLACEKSPPYAVAAYELHEDLLSTARRKVRMYLSTYALCLSSSTWPAYPDSIETLSLPYQREE